MTLTIEMYLFLCDAVSIDLSGNMSAQDEFIKKLDFMRIVMKIISVIFLKHFWGSGMQ